MLIVCARCGRPTDEQDTEAYCPDCLALIEDEDDEHEEDGYVDDYSDPEDTV